MVDRGEAGWPMLDEYAPVTTTRVRENDYYRGDVWVDVQQEDEFTSGVVLIRWVAWGGYGSAAIQLSHEEVAAIARAALGVET